MMEKEKLGTNGPLVGRLGYGAMVLEGYYGESDDDSAIHTLVHAIDSGMMIDTADAYGNGHNEVQVARALKRTANQAFIATKFGIVFDEAETGSEVPTGWGFSLNINGRPEYVRKSLEASLKRLEVDAIDLWYAHYVDPNVPIEETVGAMAEAVKAGAVRYIGLSNATAETIRRAHAVYPITAVQYEYSLWRREAEVELLPTLRELGIALVSWSPLGSGFLTGTVKALSETDFRRNNPRYQGSNLSTNQDRFAPFMEVAKELNLTPAQLALAWLLHQGTDVFPIPGTRNISRIDENAEASSVTLAPQIIDLINDIAKPGTAEGATLV